MKNKGTQTAIPVEKVEKKEEPKKVQKISATYTLRSFGKVIEKLVSLELISTEDKLKVAVIHEKALKAYINGEKIK